MEVAAGEDLKGCWVREESVLVEPEQLQRHDEQGLGEGGQDRLQLVPCMVTRYQGREFAENSGSPELRA